MARDNKPVPVATVGSNLRFLGSDFVNYYGDNWVTWLSAKMLLYAKVYNLISAVIPEEEDEDYDDAQATYDGDSRYSISSSYATKIAMDYAIDGRDSRSLTIILQRHVGIAPQDWIVSSSSRKNRTLLKRLLYRRMKELEPYRDVRDFPVMHNARTLGEMFGLTEKQIELLAVSLVGITGGFAIQYLFDDVVRWDDDVDFKGFLKSVLGFTEKDISLTRNPGGRVALAGLPCIDWTVESGWVVSITEIVYTGGALAWGKKKLTKKSMGENFFLPEKKGQLKLDNFDYMKKDVALLMDYLGAAARENRKGANVFIYGPPGTGKTQLARVVGKAAGLDLYCTRDADEDENAKEQFRQYYTAQVLLEKNSSPCCLIMDEAEDFFNRSEFGRQNVPHATITKHRFNATFEENAVPTIWISNSLEVDPAHLRRFGVVLELPIPPRYVRSGIFRKYTRGLRLRKSWVDELAQNPYITPADIESAAQVIKIAGGRVGKAAEQEMQTVLNGKLKARGVELQKKEKLETKYDISLSTADVGLDDIAAGLLRSGEGRICLYGPPGTGKTAFARYVAEKTNKPLLSKKASDLLSMWVGESEKLIAGMFRRAELDDAVLLLDEADSFLYDRRGASRSWEVTQVNEMLVQMEHFHGIFLCSSNLIDGMDQAVFRRFDIKVRFDWMNLDQKVQMLRQLTREKPTDLDLRRLRDLSLVTPGDFAALSRRFRVLRKQPSVSEVIAELENEMQFKEGGNEKKAGFRV